MTLVLPLVLPVPVPRVVISAPVSAPVSAVSDSSPATCAAVGSLVRVDMWGHCVLNDYGRTYHGRCVLELTPDQAKALATNLARAAINCR